MTELQPKRDLDEGRATSASAKPSSNSEVAYREIKRRILENDYAVGSTASVGDVAEALGMSRTPIRDALIRLEGERLVKLTPRHGFQILPISARDMAEIYRILTAMELLAIELTIERDPEEDEFAALEAAVAGLERALRGGDLLAWARSDEAFHQALLALSGNGQLLESVTRFQDLTRRARMITLHLRSRPTISTESHRDLVIAIRSKDVELACRLHRSQRLRSGRELMEILQKLDIRHL